MRILKNGEVRYKASAYKEGERLSGESCPMTIYRRDTLVQIYLGTGWAKGRVCESTKKHCSVRLLKDQRLVSCSDNRNLKLAEK